MSQQTPDMDRYFKAIGQVTHNFGNLETFLSFVAMTLISGDQAVGQIVTSRMSFSTLCSTIEALADHHFKENHDLLEGFKLVVSEARLLEQKRNDMTHSGSGENEEASLSSMRFLLRKGRLQHRMKATTPEQLEELAESIKNVPIAALLNDLAQTDPEFDRRLKGGTLHTSGSEGATTGPALTSDRGRLWL